jgi:putative flippase GtrA
MTLYDQHGEKIRYLAVGVWNTVFSYALFWVAVKTLSGPLEAATQLDTTAVAVVLQWSCWVIAVVQSTVTMKYFAFRSKGNLGPQILRAYFIYLPAQGLSTLILWGSMQLLGLSAPVGQLLAVFVTTIFSYFGHKYFTFRVPLEVGEVPPQDLIEHSSGTS